MDVTLFLAQAFGLYFIIAGIGLVLKQSSLNGLISRLSSDRISVMITGFLTLIVGIPLLLIHNVWGTTLEVIISLLVWLTFIKGASRVIAPDMFMSMGSSLADNMTLTKVLIWLMIVLGAYLAYVGFGTM